MERLGPRLLSWASILEAETLRQAEKTASMPFIYPHVALMPDAHLGKGATVGSVIPTEGAVIPAAVGVDIGCGMIAVHTQFTRQDFDKVDLTLLRKSIERRVPLSAGAYNQRILPSAEPRVAELEERAAAAGFDPGIYLRGWRLQLGSLGSGNHFIEVTVDENDDVWLFLHSGSRGVGNKLAQHHIGIARRLCADRRIDLPDRDLAYLTEDTEEFWTYIEQLRWAQHFALLNREEMMDRLIAAVSEATRRPLEERRRVNCHHNYTTREVHFGREVWLSRKGAIDASVGRWGLIPGSMGTPSYVVRGKGNELALRSSPHGAGRQFSRSAARRRFDLNDLTARMRGIEWRRTAAFLDEHPEAYKDIDRVMADAADLVDIQHVLRQIVNVKGE